MNDRSGTSAGVKAESRLTIVSDRSCVRCGYNLVGAMSDSACPECGAGVRESLGDVELMSYGVPAVRRLAWSLGRLGIAPALDVVLAIVTIAVLTIVGASHSVGAHTSAFGVVAVAREIAQVGVYAVGAAGLTRLADLPIPLGGPGAPWLRRLFQIAAAGQVAFSLLALMLVMAIGRHPANDGRADAGWIPRDLAQTCWFMGLCLGVHSTERVRWLFQRRAHQRFASLITAAGSVLTLLGIAIVFRGCLDPLSMSEDRKMTSAHGWLWAGGYLWGTACTLHLARTMSLVRRAEASAKLVALPHPS